MDNIGFEERRAGFTLVELLTVIAVIAIIAGIIFAVAAIAAKKAAITAAQADLERLVYLLQDYKLRDGRYYSSSLTNESRSEQTVLRWHQCLHPALNTLQFWRGEATAVRPGAWARIPPMKE